MIDREFVGRKNKNEIIGLPALHDGSIVCGSVSKSDLYKSDLKLLDRKVLSLETEAGGVFQVGNRNNIPCIAIRGICDYADDNKNKLEDQTGGNLRMVAADNAISLIALQIKNPQFHKFLDARRQQILFGYQSLQAPRFPDDYSDQVLIDVRESIHTRLAELSPEYKGKPAGYRSPLPRIRPPRAGVSVAPAIRITDEVSILEASTLNKVIALNVPRYYPDKSLPWVIASELSFIEVNGQQALPVVVDGESVVPPLGTLASAAPLNLDDVVAHGKVRPIIIVSGFDLQSRSRSTFLRKQMDLYPDAHFIIISSETGALLSDTENLTILGAVRYDVCDISFFDISTFIARTFEMPEQQASVVAFRLYQLFKRFNLTAHPTFFAGVAAEVLTALLRANRRSELLQLAVGGFLSFLVASDKDNVILSRTTREVFLRRLAFEKTLTSKLLIIQN